MRCLTFGVILYIIISYTILSSSSDLSSLLPFHLSSSSLLLIYILFLFPPLPLSFLSQSISSLLSLSSPSSNPHSKYTCRELVILIYIPDSSPNNLTPHKLSEVNVEWCSFNVCVSVSQVRCFVLVGV